MLHGPPARAAGAAVPDTYTVEVVNLGRRPVPGVTPRTVVLEGRADATEVLHRVVGELVVVHGLTPLGSERMDPVGPDGLVAATRLTHPEAGGRVEVLLRWRAGVGESGSAEDPDDDA
jgi:hypothetical protein